MKIRYLREGDSAPRTMELQEYVEHLAQKNGTPFGRLVETLVKRGVLTLEDVDNLFWDAPWSIEGVEGEMCPKCKQDTWVEDRCFNCSAIRLKEKP